VPSVRWSQGLHRLPFCSQLLFSLHHQSYQSHRFLNFEFLVVCECLQVKTDIVLKLSDQKTRGFVIQIVLPRWFSERGHQLFGVMPVWIYIVL
jgi:hypothetical protein